MPHLVHGIINNLGNPFIFDFIDPSVVVVIYGHFQI